MRSASLIATTIFIYFLGLDNCEAFRMLATYGSEEKESGCGLSGTQGREGWQGKPEASDSSDQS